VADKHSDQSYGKALYKEVLRWSLPVWAFILFMELSILLAVWAALSNRATWITAFLLTPLTIFLFIKSRLKITVTQGWLLVGPAAIERAFIHNFKYLNPSEMRKARGIGGNPLDYLQIRFWVSTGVKMDIRDPRDKTTAWLISSKNGEKLVSLLANPVH
jgi:hypothetical protein